MTRRLDKELVARGEVSSRSRAAQLISDGMVTVDGVVVQKPSTGVAAEAHIRVAEAQQWVSRAAHKLLGALAAFPELDPSGKRCLDAGASTGGFTQVLLSRGAEHVVALDVGHHQLAPQLREDPRVTNREGTNLRYVNPDDVGAPFELIVADLSFISLRLVLSSLSELSAEEADLLVMVKPQFEVGRDRLPRTGVVTSAEQRREAVEGVIAEAAGLGLRTVGLVRSALAGQDGNAEFFLHLHTATPPVTCWGDKVGEVDMHTAKAQTAEFTDWW